MRGSAVRLFLPAVSDLKDHPTVIHKEKWNFLLKKTPLLTTYNSFLIHSFKVTFEEPKIITVF